MIFGIYTVHDVKGEYYLPTFLSRNDTIAKRMIVDAINRTPTMPMSEFAEDFRLVKIGEFDEVRGEVVSVPQLDLGSCRYIMTEARRIETPVDGDSDDAEA